MCYLIQKFFQFHFPHTHFELETMWKRVFLTSGIKIGWDPNESAIFGYFEKYVKLTTTFLPPCGQVGAVFPSIWILLVMFWIFSCPFYLDHSVDSILL